MELSFFIQKGLFIAECLCCFNMKVNGDKGCQAVFSVNRKYMKVNGDNICQLYFSEILYIYGLL